MPEPREGRVRVPIRWRDLDLLGHVNQSVYHELLEEGRGALFSRLEENAFPFVLVHVELDYRTEVRRDHEWVEVVSRVGRVGTKSVTIEERIERSDGAVADRGPQRARRLGPGRADLARAQRRASASRSAWPRTTAARTMAGRWRSPSSCQSYADSGVLGLGVVVRPRPGATGRRACGP